MDVLPKAKVHRVRGVKIKIVTACRCGIQVAVRSKPERREAVGKYFFTPQSGIGLM